MSAHAGYRTEVKVKPTGEAHQFIVDFKISQVDKDGKSDVVSAPKLVVTAGQEGRVEVVVAEKQQNGVFCTSLVKETDVGLEVTTTVTIKKDGAEVLSSSQCVTVR